MRKIRSTEEQIVRVLRQQEAGMKVADICREFGNNDQTFYNLKAKYGGMSVCGVRRMKSWEAQVQRLQRLVANRPCRSRRHRKWLGKSSKPCRPKDAVEMMQLRGLGERKACREVWLGGLLTRVIER